MMQRFKKISFVMVVIAGLSPYVHADELQDISQNIASTPDLINKGKTIFTANCTSCHGTEGKGDGPASVAFNPKPRNFTAEVFKQGSSPAAVLNTLTNGLGSMPSFASLPVADRLAVAHYILSLSPHKQSDTPEALAKIGLGPDGKPLAGFNANKLPELPVDFIIERMAEDGDVKKVNVSDLSKALEEQSKKVETQVAVPAAPDLKRGKVMFSYCVACHGPNGEGTKLAGAPQIAGQDTDYLIRQLKHFQTGVRGAHQDDVGGLKMRPMSRILRSEEDVINVANYVSSLKPSPAENLLGGNAEKGKMYYTTCMACHGPDAKGMKAMNAPALVHLSDWYITTQIHNFKAGIRGTNSQDTNGATMRGMAMSLVDDEAIKDVAAYIQSLQK